MAERELRTLGHVERPFLVVAVGEDAMVVRAALRGGAPAHEHRIARAEVEAVARLGLPLTRRLPWELLDRGVPTAHPAFVAGLLPALEEDAGGG